MSSLREIKHLLKQKSLKSKKEGSRTMPTILSKLPIKAIHCFHVLLNDNEQELVS